MKLNFRRAFWLVFLGLLGVFCVGKVVFFASLGMLCFGNGFYVTTGTGNVVIFVLGLLDLVADFVMFGVVLGLHRKVEVVGL